MASLTFLYLLTGEAFTIWKSKNYCPRWIKVKNAKHVWVKHFTLRQTTKPSLHQIGGSGTRGALKQKSWVGTKKKGCVGAKYAKNAHFWSLQEDCCRICPIIVSEPDLRSPHVTEDFTAEFFTRLIKINFIRMHSAPTEGVMHLFDPNWWFWLICWAKWDGLDLTRCQKPPQIFFDPQGGQGGE